MHRTLLFFIISIFLCGALSTNAQVRAELELKAVELERIVYSSDDPFEVNDALFEKAMCYKQCKRFSDAVKTLSRVRMYMLAPEMQGLVMYEKELCSYLAGDFDEAAAYSSEAEANGIQVDGPQRLVLDALVFGECGKWEDSRRCAEDFISTVYDGEELAAAKAQIGGFFSDIPKLKKQGTATALAFLPPAGHWYTGNFGEGLLSMGLNAAAAGWCAWQCISGDWISGLLGGGIALNYTFMGNQERVSWLVDKYNHDSLREFNDSLRILLLSHNAAE